MFRNGWFRPVTLAFSALSACLAAAYLIRPDLMFLLFGLASENSGLVMARRGGALFLGIAILLFGARQTEDRQVRLAVAGGLATACAVLAALGVWELAAGHAKPGIALAIVTELVCALCYLVVVRQEQRR